MKATFAIPRLSQLEEAALLSQEEIAAKIRAELPNANRAKEFAVKHEEANSYRLQAELSRSLSRIEEMRGNRDFQTPEQHRAYIEFLQRQAANCDADADRITHEIATGAK